MKSGSGSCSRRLLPGALGNSAGSSPSQVSPNHIAQEPDRKEPDVVPKGEAERRVEARERARHAFTREQADGAINREYPTTSAARIAARRLWTRFSATGLSQTRVGGEILCERGDRVHEGRFMASGHGWRYYNEAHFDRIGRFSDVTLTGR